jgi:hypothetical protein
MGRKGTVAGRERHATNAALITAITIALIRSRRLKYVGDKESAQKLDGISLPTIPAVVIHFYASVKMSRFTH